MKLNRILAIACAVLALGFQSVGAQSLSPSTKWHWDKGTIVIDTPERPAGQEHVLGLTAAPIKTVRVGFVGLGMRGPSAVIRFCQIPGIEIVALCDYEEKGPEVSKLFDVMSDYRYIFVSKNYVFYRIEEKYIRIINLYHEKEDFMWQLFGVDTTPQESLDYWKE
jgi:hypothetical protein